MIQYLIVLNRLVIKYDQDQLLENVHNQFSVVTRYIAPFSPLVPVRHGVISCLPTLTVD